GTGPADPVDGYGGLPARTRTAVPRAGGARGTRDRPGRARTRATVLRLARSAAGVNGALEPGAVFAGYRIERLLGTGGMGQVYLARDRDLPRPVALKLLNPTAGDGREVRARFLREADTVARLAHPNIVAVYARGEE